MRNLKRNTLNRAACLAVLLALMIALLPAYATPAAAADNELPEAFDLREVDTDGDGVPDACWVTPVKCQNPFGTCWGFSAIASAETSILSSGLAAQDGYAAYADPEKGLKELNLSEKHLAYFALKTIDDPADPQYGEGLVFSGPEGSSDIYNTGGYSYYATTLFAAGIGPVHENLDEQLEYRGKGGWYLAYVSGSGDNIIPLYLAAADDWNIDGELHFLQSYTLKESIILQPPTGLSGEEWEEAVRAFKEVLYSGHALQIGFYADTSTPGQEVTTEYISANWAHYTYEPIYANHGVTIIGWDDRYPKENFAHKTMDGEDAPLPERDGAWLVKNSWGSDEQEFPNSGAWGLLQGQDKGVYNPETGKYEYNAIEGAVNTGYFWLSYCDMSIDIAEALEFDSVTAEEGYYIAEHDYMPVTRMSALFFEDEASMANVFCVGDEVDAARLEMVSCQTFLPNVDLHVDVYLLDEDWETPTDGALVSQADACYRYGGFHKLMLDTPVVLLRDRYFSVVITQRTADGLYTCNYQLSYNKNLSDAYGYLDYAVSVINPRESYSGWGSEWWDLSEDYADLLELIAEDDALYYDMDNYPIKAYLAVPDEAEVPRTAADYGDLEQGAYYCDAVSWSLEQDIAIGTTPETFSPEEACSRAQAVTWLWRAAGMPEPEAGESPFRDVTKDDYFYYAALWAAEKGIINGVKEGVFAPGATVTRAQLAAILYRYEQLQGGGFTGLWAFRLDFPDEAKVPEYAYEPFCWLTMNGVFQGDDTGLRPNDLCTRAQALSVLWRYFTD